MQIVHVARFFKKLKEYFISGLGFMVRICESVKVNFAQVLLFCFSVPSVPIHSAFSMFYSTGELGSPFTHFCPQVIHFGIIFQTVYFYRALFWKWFFHWIKCASVYNSYISPQNTFEIQSRFLLHGVCACLCSPPCKAPPPMHQLRSL